MPKSQQGKCRPLDLPICPSAHPALDRRARDPPSSMKIGRRRKWLGVRTGAELEQDWGPSLADQHLQPLRCPEPELISARWTTRDGGMLRVTSRPSYPLADLRLFAEALRRLATGPASPRLPASHDSMLLPRAVSGRVSDRSCLPAYLSIFAGPALDAALTHSS